MSARRIALLSFEVSRWAPETASEAFAPEEPFDETLDDDLGEESFEGGGDASFAGEADATFDDAGLDASGDASAALDDEEEFFEDERFEEGSLEGKEGEDAFEAGDDDFEPDATLASADASFAGVASFEGESFEDESFEDESFEHASFADEFEEDAPGAEEESFEDEASPAGDGFAGEVEEELLDDERFDEGAEKSESDLAGSDRAALASWMRTALADALAGSRAFAPLIIEVDGDAAIDSALDDLDAPLFAEPAAAAAVATNAEVALLCTVRASSEGVELSGLVADAGGEERVRFTLAATLGAAWQLPRRAAREILLALGEDAAVPDEVEEEGVDGEAVLALCRGARALAEIAGGVSPRRPATRAPRMTDVTPPGPDATSPAPDATGPREETGLELPAPREVRGDEASRADPTEAIGELIEAVSLAPALLPARDLLLRTAAAAAGGPSMPAFLTALQRLESLLPGDAQVLLGLADYLLLHREEERARALLLRARDLADGAGEEAAVLSRLAAIAESAGRPDEALMHLRAATRLADDASLYLRLGQLLRGSDLSESVRAFQRAAVLAPQDALPRLLLGEVLRDLDDLDRAAIEAARAAQLAQAQPEHAAAAAELIRDILSRSGSA